MKTGTCSSLSMPDQTKREILKELSRIISENENAKELFSQWRNLLGFRIGWIKTDVAQSLLSKYGVAMESCEIIMMQAYGRTECHLHREGATTFMALGREHGFENPSGGTLFADFSEEQSVFELSPEYAAAGEIFDVPAGKIHAFFADEDKAGTLTAIGIVSPTIKHGDDKFDVVEFDYVDRKGFEVTLRQ